VIDTSSQILFFWTYREVSHGSGERSAETIRHFPPGCSFRWFWTACKPALKLCVRTTNLLSGQLNVTRSEASCPCTHFKEFSKFRVRPPVPVLGVFMTAITVSGILYSSLLSWDTSSMSVSGILYNSILSWDLSSMYPYASNQSAINGPPLL